MPIPRWWEIIAKFIWLFLEIYIFAQYPRTLLHTRPAAATPE
jgi:hypothetical protein